MATNDKPCNNDPRQHNAPPIGPKQPDTGLKKFALEDWQKRLIVNTERPHNGGR